MGIPDMLSQDNSLLVILSEDKDLKLLQNKDSGYNLVIRAVTRDPLSVLSVLSMLSSCTC